MWSFSSSSNANDGKIKNLERSIQDLQKNVNNVKQTFSNDSATNQSDLIHALYTQFNRLKDQFDDLNDTLNNGNDARFENMEKQLATLRTDLAKALELQEKANEEIQNRIVQMKILQRNAESDIASNRIRDRDYGGANVPLPRSRIRRN